MCSGFELSAVPFSPSPGVLWGYIFSLLDISYQVVRAVSGGLTLIPNERANPQSGFSRSSGQRALGSNPGIESCLSNLASRLAYAPTTKTPEPGTRHGSGGIT